MRVGGKGIPRFFEKTASVESISSVILVGVLVSPWVYRYWILPSSPFYQNYDPEIQYFMNSLLVFKGRSYYYVDHPGTPLEIIGSIFLVFMYLFSSDQADSFIVHQLRAPDLFLGIAQLFITLANVYCALYLKKLLSNSSRRLEEWLVSMAVPLMFYVIHPYSFQTLILWSHTSFNFPFGTLFLAYLCTIAAHKNELTTNDMVALGVFSGLLASVMIYFSVWLVGILVFIIVWYRIEKVRWGKILLVSAIIASLGVFSFLLMLMPAFRRVSYFLGWIHDLIFHQSIYGTGPEGITSFSLFTGNLAGLYQVSPSLFIIPILALLIIISLFVWNRKTLVEKPGLWALSFGLLSQIVIVGLLVTKHAKDIYLLALAAMIPVLVIVVLKLLDHAPRLRRVFVWIVIAFVFIRFPPLFGQFFESQSFLTHKIKNIEIESKRIITEYENSANKQDEKALVLWAAGAYSPCISLLYGNDSTGYAFNPELSLLCKKQHQFIIFVRRPFIRGDLKELSEVNWDLIITSKDVLDSYEYLAGLGIVREFLYRIVVIYRR